MATVETLRTTLDVAIAETPRAAQECVDTSVRLVLDLRRLSFIDSTGLHVLIRANRRAKEGQLRLLRGSRRIHRVFELTGTDKRLPFAD